jgi:hypothetical protein
MKNGVITPVASATENRVYLKPGNLFQLDTRVPGPVDPVDPPGDDYDFVYPAGLGSYTPGETVVKGTDGKLYACRPFPEGAWCNINADAYRPGTGSPGAMPGSRTEAGHRGGVMPPPVHGVAASGRHRAAVAGHGRHYQAYLLLTYFSRRICGLPRPAAFSSSAQASTMSGLPHR